MCRPWPPSCANALHEGAYHHFLRSYLHSDNGAPMKSQTLLSKMHDLGITPSRGRPRVSNDSPYSESLFRTLKYCPQWPKDGFADLEEARGWVRDFMRWYNHEHRHSRIRFVTLAERHRGEDHQVLRSGMRCISKPVLATRGAGQVRHATGRPSERLCSIRIGHNPRWKRRHKKHGRRDNYLEKRRMLGPVI
uniref:Putative integrase n=1 Tax=Stutzerimonas stutzeri TaxID=316 RepID=A0A0S2UP18_STUST|nr:putative integrase [Stutzerimonas stutzeri]